MPGSSFKFRFAFICEDARREDNGKMMFLGVYGQNIIVKELPFQSALCMPVWFEALQRLDGRLGFRVMCDGELQSEGGGTIQSEVGLSVLSMQPIFVHLEKPGLLEFQIRFSEDEWITATTIPVVFRPTTDSNASRQPS